MDTRDLSIMIGQALNLAHNEAMKMDLTENEINDFLANRVPTLLLVSMEIRENIKKKLSSPSSKPVKRYTA